MNRHAQWKIVARREISVKLHDKTFIGSTVFLLVLVLGFLVVPSLLGGGDSKVAVVDADGSAVVRLADQQGGDLEAVQVADVRAAERTVADGDADAALVPRGEGFALVGDTSVDSDIAGSLTPAVSSWAMERNAGEAGLTPDRLYAGAQVHERLLQPSDVSQGLVTGLKIGFAFLFYMTALSFGMVLSQSVVQEKESRVVEILRATMPSRTLLTGKIVGNTVLALGQLVAIAAAGVVGAVATGRTDLLTQVGPAAAWFLPFFVLGFVALAGVFAVAGSMATRQEDLQSTTLPAQAVLGIPLMLLLAGSEQVLSVMSYIPIASSFAMPARIAAGQTAVWEPLLSVAIVLAATVALIGLAARLYDASLLQTQGAATWRGLFRSRAAAART